MTAISATSERLILAISANRNAIAVLALLGAGAMLGMSTNIAKLSADAGVSVLVLLAWSATGAAAILFAWTWTKGDRPRLNWRTGEYFFAAALVTVAAPNLIFFSAVPHVGVGFVALAITLPPLLTYVGAILLRMESFDPKRALGVVLAFAGAGYLALRQLEVPDAPVFWIVLSLLGPILLAVGNLYRTIRWPQGASAESLAPGMLAAAGILVFLTALTTGRDVALPLDNAAGLFLIVAQSLVFAAQFLLMFIVQKMGGPVFLSLLGGIAAIFGVPVAVLLLGETAPDGLAIAGALIAAGIVLLLSRRRNT